MNSRKYRIDPTLLLKQGKDIIESSSDDERYIIRVLIVNMVLSGNKASSVADISGYSKVTVSGWVKTVNEEGFEALRPRPHLGKKAKLSDEQYDAIDLVLQTSPQDHGFKVWDGPSLSSYISNTYGIDLSVRQCQRMFHKLGYSRIRPQTFPSKDYEDTAERGEFKKNEMK